MDVPDPLRQVLDSRHAIQQFVPASLASTFPYFCFCGFHGYTGFLGTLPHLSSFVLQLVCSLRPPLHSHGMEVSQKMALRPRNLFIFNWRIIALQYCVGFCHTSIWTSHGHTYVLSFLNLPPHLTPLGNQSSGFELPLSYSRFLPATYFTHSTVRVSILLSLFIPPSPFPHVHKSFSMSASPLLLCK